MRTFYEVGEGLFTVERVAGFNFVYDCGGQRFDDNNGGKGIRTIVKETFSEGEEIEAVFISHYDNDHINGIYTLLTHCKVKRLILPMMSDLQRCWYIVTQIYNSVLRLDHFPSQWKCAEIIMIPKPNKPENIFSSYIPKSLLCIFSKIFEKLLLRRLSPILENKTLFQTINLDLGRVPVHLNKFTELLML